MKRVFLALFAVVVTAPVFAQNTTDSIKVQFSISDSLDYSLLDSRIIKHVYRIIVDYINDKGYVQDPDDHEFNQILKLESKDEFFANLKPSTHNPVKGGIYNLKFEITSEQRCLFIMTHLTKQGGDKIENNTDSYSIDWLQKEQAQKLVAYELIEECFGPTEAVSKILNELREAKEEYEVDLERKKREKEEKLERERKKQEDSLERARKEQIREDKIYTALSFLPPFNQCRFNDKKTCKNILAGYGLSIITYGISTYYYNSFKSDYDNNKHVDLEETNKALKSAEDGMRICRTGQIASGILFLGTYFYGVYTSLHNRNTYQKSQNLTLVPAAYDNGAGVALVYRF